MNEVQKLTLECKGLSTYYHESGIRSREFKSIAENLSENVVAWPTYFEVRWAEYTLQLFKAVLRNWYVSVEQFKSSNERGMLRTWTNKSNLHLLAVSCDVLDQLERLQKRLQSDSTFLLDIKTETDILSQSLQKMLERPLLGGNEEVFLSNLTENNGQLTYKGIFYKF